MRPLTFSLALLMLLALQGMAVADDAQNAKLEELWKTGSLWQVGDNIPKVEAARKEIVAAGDAGLAFIYTKLSSTDGLEYRCIEAVFKGFGAKALPGLYERLAHEDVKVRRNVAAMLGVIDDKSAGPKMVEHLKKESDLRCKVGHLQTLARWKEPTALDALIECTRVTQEQEPLAERLKVRIVPLLANYYEDRALARLFELLTDDAYFIRDAAAEAWATMARNGHSKVVANEVFLICRDTANWAPPRQDTTYLRRLFKLFAELAAPKLGRWTGFELFFSVHRMGATPGIRGEAWRAIPIYWRGIRDHYDMEWHGNGEVVLGRIDEVLTAAEEALKTEDDPYVLGCIESAQKELAGVRTHWVRK